VERLQGGVNRFAKVKGWGGWLFDASDALKPKLQRAAEVGFRRRWAYVLGQ
jgi:hypothetical protein